ncbi:MAG: SDR family NAD(P)-dependent oxidoreductase [Vulcanimicrobiaceae bacterium]
MATVTRPPIDGAAALVTGASAGIGRELARAFAARVASLVVVARRAERLEQLRNELAARHPQLKVSAFAADLAEEGEVDGLLLRVREHIGPMDVLVNAAGLGAAGLYDQTEWRRTRQVLRTNVLALAQLCAGLVPEMVSRGRGGVLNIGSGAGLAIMPSAAAYAGSKYFVFGFSEALCADLAGTGVVVTHACPGPVDSEFDAVAGSPGGMAGGPPQFVRISAEQCARETLAGFEAGAALVFPGRAYRTMIGALPLIPRGLQRRQAAKIAVRLRNSGRSADPRSS